MNQDEILSLSSLPPGNPSYPHGPYRFVDREYFIVVYRSDPDALRRAVPKPLEPDGSDRVFYEWISMPDSSGFGDYSESGIVIPCRYQGEEVNFTYQMYLDNEPPLTAGREIWGFPKRYGQPRLEVKEDTLTGTLHDSGERVAMGTMTYKHENLCQDPGECREALSTTQVNLKLIPSVNGQLQIAQRVAYYMTDIEVQGYWGGPARLHLVPHVNAPVADLPVREVLEGRHYIADLTLPYGRVLYDFKEENPDLRS